MHGRVHAPEGTAALSIDEAAIIDSLELDQLRAFAHHQNRLVQKLLKEREQHLVRVEESFARRHNQQAMRIADLERTVAALKKANTAKIARRSA